MGPNMDGAATARRGSAARACVPGITVAATLLAVVALGAIASAASYGPHTTGPVSWTNGQVLCMFSPSTPSVAVSALHLAGSGLTISALTISEVAANGSTVATAHLAASSWNVSNRSSEDTYDLAYTLHAPLLGPSGASPTIGSADLEVDYLLPIYAGSPAASATTVEAVFTVANWTWQAEGDHLVMAVGAAASFPTAEHLNKTVSPGWLLVSASNASGAELDRLGLNATAAATGAGGSVEPVTTQSSLTLTNPAEAQVIVTFGATAGEFSSLTFVARVGVLLPASVAGIPLPELVAVAAAASLVSVGIAVMTRRVRQRPSKLMYVEEDP